jgi:hypothetical protein
MKRHTYKHVYNYFKNICCPQCKNYIHKKCMDIWLETNQNCVYCRSEIFSEYISDVSKI